MRKTCAKPELIENRAKIVPSTLLTVIDIIGYSPTLMKNRSTVKAKVALNAGPKVPQKIAFFPSVAEKELFQAAQEKHGVNAPAIIRMALRRYAEAEGLQLRTV
jgi:hypothetical protein